MEKKLSTNTVTRCNHGLFWCYLSHRVVTLKPFHYRPVWFLDQHALPLKILVTQYIHTYIIREGRCLSGITRDFMHNELNWLIIFNSGLLKTKSHILCVQESKPDTALTLTKTDIALHARQRHTWRSKFGITLKERKMSSLRIWRNIFSFQSRCFQPLFFFLFFLPHAPRYRV